MSDYRKLEFKKYGFTIFKYRGNFYFKFKKAPDDEMKSDLMDCGFYYGWTNVHDEDTLKRRWRRSSSENGIHGMRIAIEHMIANEENRNFGVCIEIDKSYKKDLEEYFFN